MVIKLPGRMMIHPGTFNSVIVPGIIISALNSNADDRIDLHAGEDVDR
jgi:hypothetical protein